jgi:hypothetical protein
MSASRARVAHVDLGSVGSAKGLLEVMVEFFIRKVS